MLIHEITYRQIANEGVMNAIASKAIAGLTNKLLPGAGDTQSPAAVGPGGRQAAAMAASAPLIAAMGKQGNIAWIKTLQQLIAKSEPPVTSVAELRPDVIPAELQAVINQLARFDTAELEKNTENGELLMVAKELAARKDEVVKQSLLPKPGSALQVAWNKLAEMIVQAQNSRQVHGTGTGVNGVAKGVYKDPKDPTKYLIDMGTGPEPYNPSNPVHKAEADKQAAELAK